MKIVILDCKNALRNYAFVIIDTLTHECAVIDPMDTNIITDYLSEQGLNLKYILCTHHHHDHIGGNLHLKALYNCAIYGHYHDKHRIDGITDTVIGGEQIALFNNRLKFDILNLDGHTIGHIGFYAPEHKWLFSGDTLFNMGCGRRFEGSTQQYYDTMNTIMQLPPDTMIYATHEYTVDNIKFAKHIMPHHYIYYTQFLEYCENQINKRNHNLPTIPFDLESQKKFNPFLLSNLPIIKTSLGMDNHHNHDVFGAMRMHKDNF
jgi:hydroxyacylglutathione hydrolase